MHIFSAVARSSTLLRSTFCLSMSHHWLQLCQFTIKEKKTLLVSTFCIAKLVSQRVLYSEIYVRLWIRIFLCHLAARELRTQKPVYLSVGFSLLCFGDPIFLFEHQQRHSECLLTLPRQTQLDSKNTGATDRLQIKIILKKENPLMLQHVTSSLWRHHCFKCILQCCTPSH